MHPPLRATVRPDQRDLPAYVNHHATLRFSVAFLLRVPDRSVTLRLRSAQLESHRGAGNRETGRSAHTQSLDTMPPKCLPWCTAICFSRSDGMREPSPSAMVPAPYGEPPWISLLLKRSGVE